ncbi:uncharacterized protein LOC120669513 [Panicum virgatum]|uniref:uncharacterized protein LOC120669513 n=1 Tax=Panicum virgatum TaxID=38727 RepID=UPI0019D62ED0|nr:uncharacterized protein LOC120669513 [Panicum virgatum]
MATRRRRGLADCNRAYMEPEENDSSEAASESDDIELIDCDVDSDEIDGSSSSDDVELKRELYKQVLLDFNRIKELKSKLKTSFSHQRKKMKSSKKPKDVFTRFSVKAFSSVIEALTPDEKIVIERYGFGALLHFDKCFVPNNFAKWVANLVDYKSGDIVLDGKVISLTKESVHSVLGLPIGGSAFPSDTVSGKSTVLEKIGKSSMPSVTFFVNKLTKNKEILPDEDFFICFMLVALNTFLCPNSSVSPSPIHFGIFADVERAKEFDWSAYVLNWLIESIKLFKKGKSSKATDSTTLGGCLYYLTVMYLDYVDFGPRRPPHTLPRISIWKGDMIKTYSDLDLKSPGCYGFRPLLDYCDTCYSKNPHLFDNPTYAASADSEFLAMIDSVSRYIASDVNNGTRASPLVPNVSSLCPEKQPSVHTQFTNKNSKLHSDHDGRSDLIPSSSNLNSSLLNQEHVTKFLDKLTRMRNSPATPKSSSKDFIRPANSCPPSWFAEEKLRVANSKLSTGKSVFQSGVGSLRTALHDISNGNMFGTQHSRNPTPNSCNRDLGKDIIMLEDDVEFVPDSYSPNSRPSQSGAMRDKEDSPPRFTPNLSSKRPSSTSNRNVSFALPSKTLELQKSPEVQVLREATLAQTVRSMTRRSDEMYNKKFSATPCSKATPVLSTTPTALDDASANSSYGLPRYQHRDSSTGGKVPIHGPRRVVKPGPLFNVDFETTKKKISVSKSELRNYKAICNLATSQFSNEDAVSIAKVRCTFWSPGESLKPGGLVNSFVVSAFCYSLYMNPAGAPDVSKSHYFFANIGENLHKDFDDANQDTIARAFKRSSRSRPLNHSNNLYFPICINDHWFVFVVDIKDRKFVFLDSLYHKDHEFQEIARDRLIPSFQLYWDRFVQVGMGFDEYEVLYPDVPLQPSDNIADSGIYAMMFLQCWKSPRSVLRNIFDSSDIPIIRVKIANDLLFLPGNSGMKNRVIEYEF